MVSTPEGPIIQYHYSGDQGFSKLTWEEGMTPRDFQSTAKAILCVQNCECLTHELVCILDPAQERGCVQSIIKFSLLLLSGQHLWELTTFQTSSSISY